MESLNEQELEKKYRSYIEELERESVFTKQRIDRIFQEYFDIAKIPLDGALLAHVLSNIE